MLYHHRGGSWGVVLPSTQSLDPSCCSPSTLLEHEPLASSTVFSLFHGCIPLNSCSKQERFHGRLSCCWWIQPVVPGETGTGTVKVYPLPGTVRIELGRFASGSTF